MLNNKIVATVAGSLALGLASTAVAGEYPEREGFEANGVEVVERDAQGKATKVRVNGEIIDVCMSEEQDGCIQPRAAGLGWGDMPLSYYPGG